jgi:predicted transcriptional regulator
MPVSIKKFIHQIAGKKAPGPSTTFTVFHIFYSLKLIAQKPLGRKKLAEKLEVGEGAVRTIISRLKEEDLIETSKQGCNLTRKGLDIWKQFEEIFPKQMALPRSDLSSSEFNYVFLVKNCGQKVKSGINQRDAAIFAGARNALVIVYRNGHLCIEFVSSRIEQDYPIVASQILNELTPEENDVIIVAGADSLLRAKRGAFAASWSLISF